MSLETLSSNARISALVRAAAATMPLAASTFGALSADGDVTTADEVYDAAKPVEESENVCDI